MSQGVLYLVATPIGNRADISFRAIETLKTVDLIAAEDTRHSGRLLDYYQIRTPVLSLHNYNEAARTELLCDRLKNGAKIALIADAGTPLISDPGYVLIRAVRAISARVVPVPGPCALVAALISSGLPTHHFIFEGFIPPKGEARRKRLLALREETRTIILYESVHRIIDLIDLLWDIFGGDREVSISRELTKQFETIKTDTLDAVRRWLMADPDQRKGEFVVVIKGYKEQEKTLSAAHERTLGILLKELPLKQAVVLAAEITGVSRKKLYTYALMAQKIKT